MIPFYILMALCALLAAIFVMPIAIREWKATVRCKSHRGRERQLRTFLRIVFAPIYYALDRFMGWLQRVEHGTPPPIALANALGLINEHGIESLLIDPASANLPFTGRFLLIQRGASGYQYGDLCAGGAGGSLPLGISSDSPYAVGDVLNVRRLGARPGLEIGIASGAITIDHLVYSAASGKIADLTLAGNGTYWVVGRAAGTVAANNSTMECPFVPDLPYQVTVSNGGGTYAFVAGT